MVDNLKFLFVTIFILLTSAASAQNITWQAEEGMVKFTSEAPLELIQAESKALRGIIVPSTNSFGFSVRINSFEGFNGEMQKTHFQENYLEQKKFPQATFKGKFIEDIPYGTPGTYSIRAKGNLDIHGVSKERIIRGTLTIKEGSMKIQTNFLVPVADHGITIPKIVMQKIAEEIDVKVDIDFIETKPQ